MLVERPSLEARFFRARRSLDQYVQSYVSSRFWQKTVNCCRCTSVSQARRIYEGNSEISINYGDQELGTARADTRFQRNGYE